jgi:tripartite-type tricarboxylate transporter receptor subunit TctC
MRWALGLAVGALALVATAAKADAVEEFYRGKAVSVVIGYSVGGGYDAYARMLARHMGKYIPGKPTLVPQNMPGGGSLRAAQFLYSVAPKDGTSFGTVARGMATEALTGAADLDATKFTWIGSVTDEISVCAAWHTSPVKRWADLFSQELVVGGNGSGSDPDVFALLLKNVFGARIKLVTGYPGGNDIGLAMERGEVSGRCGWSWGSLKSRNAAWLKDKKVTLLAQFALARHEDLPDIPLIMDFAKTEEQQQIMRLAMARQVMGRPFLAPPGIPEDRRNALRQAFDQTMKDPEFLAETKQADMQVDPVTGKTIDELLAALYRTPREVIQKAAAAMEK